jgi:hypothetical protein
MNLALYPSRVRSNDLLGGVTASSDWPQCTHWFVNELCQPFRKKCFSQRGQVLQIKTASAVAEGSAHARNAVIRNCSGVNRTAGTQSKTVSGIQIT